MDRIFKLMTIGCLLLAAGAYGQSMHFSQYYNAPMLLSPANTALMSDDDFRIGLNYRNQWSAVPVPYNTFSAFGDFRVLRKTNEDNKSKWLGVGLAMFSDKAGDGNLSLLQLQASLAYHLQLSQYTMLSVGLSGAYVQRSVNFDNLTFDAQWDGMTFNTHFANGEQPGVVKTNYYTVGGGVNLAIFPNENLYIKLGGGVANINKPTETFYKGGKNTLDMRPEATLDVLVKTGPVLIINPSVFYATQNAASELVVGSLFRTKLGENENHMPTQLILGIFDRIGDAAIGVAGIQLGSIQFMANYDFTMSSLAPYNNGYGALEFSLIYQGRYPNNQGIKKMYTCPRFF